jgi:hypothetical protein
LSLGALVAALVGCGVAPFRASERFVLDAPWDNYERIVVRTVNGDVGLFTDGRDDIRISGTKHARGTTWTEAGENVDRLTIVARAKEKDPTTFEIELEAPPELKNRSPGASFEICVPQACAAEIVTGNGCVCVRGAKGLAQLRSSNGGIVAEDIDGHVDADTSNGRIVVDSVVGNCQLDTSNGNITVRQAHGSVEGTTSNGSISVEAMPTAADKIVLRTSNGSIRVIVPEDLPADLHLNSSNGRARARLGSASWTTATHSNSTTWGTRFEEFKASINGGGCRIDARTSNGSVSLDTR